MNRIDGTSALKPKQKYTLQEWRSWPEGERWELIHGVLYDMRANPGLHHQIVVGSLAAKLYTFLEDRACEVLIGPIDVFLQEKDEDEPTVVEPDVVVVCNPSLIQDDGIHGAPDFVAEVLSDSTAHKDLSTKKILYEQSGVKEYWIIQPTTGTVFQYVRRGDHFDRVREYLRGEPIESTAIDGFVWVCTE